MYGKVSIFLWFGLYKSIGFALKEIPPGHEDLSDLTQVPSAIQFKNISKFTFRGHIYHGRFEPCEGVDGDCQISIKVHMGTKSGTSSIVTKTMCPVWKESIMLQDIILCGEAQYYKNNPIPVVVEVWNHNSAKKTLLGRMFCKVEIYLLNEHFNRTNTTLQWFKVVSGNTVRGEILALFEMLEDDRNSNMEILDNIPKYILPKSVQYKLEVLFWGMRDTKNKKIEHPKVVVNCGEAVVESQMMPNLKYPNFPLPLSFSTVEVPENVIFSPPLVIRLFDTRSFAKSTYVGSHVVKNVHDLKLELVKLHDWLQIGNKPILDKRPTKVTFSRPTFQDEEVVSDIETTSEKTPLISHLSLKRPEELSGKAESEFNRGSKYSMSSVIFCNKLPSKIKLPQAVKSPDLDQKFDWWIKYFESTDRALENDQISAQNEMKNEKAQNRRHNKNQTSKLEVYTCELEKLSTYEGFTDALKTFEIRKSSRNNLPLGATNVVAKFKGAICVYKEEGENYVTRGGLNPKFGFYGGLAAYSEDVMHLIVRVYVIRAYQLHKKSRTGSMDSYIEIKTPSVYISDKDKYVSQDYEPVFGKCYEFETRLPFDSLIKVCVMNWKRISPHQLVGETEIDIENRYFSRHRGTCGLQEFYHRTGYNAWRDLNKPSEILEGLCEIYNLPKPKYGTDFVEVANRLFKTSQIKEDKKECLALSALRNWHTVPIIGCHLLKEHFETRSLYHPEEPGVEQGKLEMWIDMFPKLSGVPAPRVVDISPRIPDEFELRVIIWSTSRVYSNQANNYYQDEYFDLYVKAWLEGKEDLQQTDVHFRSWSGDGLFNWRLIFQFAYYREGFITSLDSRRKKEKLSKIPPVLYLQLWDSNRIFPNLYLGALALDLHRIPEPTKKLFGSQVPNPIKGKLTINLFQKRNIRGWWEFKSPNLDEKIKSEVVIAYADLEISLIKLEDAKRNPVGYGRNDPFALPTPLRPNAKFALLLAPFRALFRYVFRKHKWKFITVMLLIALIIFVLLFLYAFPGHLAERVIFPT